MGRCAVVFLSLRFMDVISLAHKQNKQPRSLSLLINENRLDPEKANLNIKHLFLILVWMKPNQEHRALKIWIRLLRRVKTPL